jgi:hypothetical protein
VGLEQGPLSLVSTIEELLERKSSVCGLEIRYYGCRGSISSLHTDLTHTLWNRRLSCSIEYAGPEIVLICFSRLLTLTLLFWRISSLDVPSFYVIVAVVGRPKHSAAPHLDRFKHFNPLTTLRESIILLSIDALMDLSTWYTFLPPKRKKRYHISLLLLGVILKFCCHVHSFIATLILIARSTDLPCPADQLWYHTVPPPFMLL